MLVAISNIYIMRQLIVLNCPLRRTHAPLARSQEPILAFHLADVASGL
jgi:hypothetical protein